MQAVVAQPGDMTVSVQVSQAVEPPHQGSGRRASSPSRELPELRETEVAVLMHASGPRTYTLPFAGDVTYEESQVAGIFNAVAFAPKELDPAEEVFGNNVWCLKAPGVIADFTAFADVVDMSDVIPFTDAMGNAGTVAAGGAAIINALKAKTECKKFYAERNFDNGLAVVGAFAKIGNSVSQLVNGAFKIAGWVVPVFRKGLKEAFASVSDITEIVKNGKDWYNATVDETAPESIQQLQAAKKNASFWALAKSVAGLALHGTMLVGFIFAIVWHPLVATTLAAIYLAALAISTVKDAYKKNDASLAAPQLVQGAQRA